MVVTDADDDDVAVFSMIVGVTMATSWNRPPEEALAAAVAVETLTVSVSANLALLLGLSSLLSSAAVVFDDTVVVYS